MSCSLESSLAHSFIDRHSVTFPLACQSRSSLQKWPRPVLQIRPQNKEALSPAPHTQVSALQRKASRSPKPLCKQLDNPLKSERKLTGKGISPPACSQPTCTAQQHSRLAFAKANHPILDSGHLSTSQRSELAALFGISLDPHSFTHMHTKSYYFHFPFFSFSPENPIESSSGQRPKKPGTHTL